MKNHNIEWEAICAGTGSEADWEALRVKTRSIIRDQLGEDASESVIEDYSHDVMVEMLDSDKLEKLSSATVKPSYFASMVKNGTVSRIRREKVHNTSQVKYAERIVRSSLGEPINEAIKNEEVSNLQDAINQLSELDQELIRSFHLEDESIPQLSQRLGEKPTNITTRLNRARKQLRRILKN